MKYASYFSECVSRPPATISVYGAMEVEQSPCGDDEVYLSGRCMGCDILGLGSWEVCPTPCLGRVPLRGVYYEPSTYTIWRGMKLTLNAASGKNVHYFPKITIGHVSLSRTFTCLSASRKGIRYIQGTSMVCHGELHVHVISQDLI